MPFALTDRLLTRIIGIGLIAATLLNGANFYLKKIGLLNRSEYNTYWTIHNSGGPYSCGQLPKAQYLIERQYTRYLHDDRGLAASSLKLVKDVLAIIFILGSLLCLARKKASRSDLHGNAPALLLGVCLAVSGISTYINFDGWHVAFGARSFVFLLIALLGTALVRRTDMEYVANCLVILVALQLAAVFFESVYGMHLAGYSCFSPHLPARMSGFFSLPNSLGIFSAIAPAFYYSFSTSKRYLWPVLCGGVLLVFASGSATGVIALTVLSGFLLIKHTRVTRSVSYAVLLLAIVLVIAGLPSLTGRSNIFDSISTTGRAGRLLKAVSSDSISEMIFGRGLGIGTNTNTNFVRHFAVGGDGTTPSQMQSLDNLDSTMTLLFVQLGLVGVVLFYALLFGAILKDKSSGIFYAMLILTSLTINITELFPVSLLLGLSLSRSLSGIQPVVRPA